MTRKVYLVTLDTPKGQGQMEVPTMLSPEAAGRRAHITACSMGWGDLDTVRVVSVEPIPADALTAQLATVAP